MFMKIIIMTEVIVNIFMWIIRKPLLQELCVTSRGVKKTIELSILDYIEFKNIMKNEKNISLLILKERKILIVQNLHCIEMNSNLN